MVDFALRRQSGRQLVGHDVAELREEFGTSEVIGGRGRGDGGRELVVGDRESAGEAVMGESDQSLRSLGRCSGATEVNQVDLLDSALVVIVAELLRSEQVQFQGWRDLRVGGDGVGGDEGVEA